jgi:hypothetical protein
MALEIQPLTKGTLPMFCSSMLSKLKRSSQFLKDHPACVQREKQRGELSLETLEDRILLNASVVNLATTAPPHSTIGVGQTVTIDVNFTQAVTVNTSNGTPGVSLNSLNTFSSPEVAVYRSGSGTSTLAFVYTVQSGDSTNGQVLDYSSTNALMLVGGTITDALDSNAANITLPTPGGPNDALAAAQLFIDSAPPSPSPSPSPSPTPPANAPNQVQQLFQEFLAMEQSIWNNLNQAAHFFLQDGGNPSAGLSTSQLIQEVNSFLGSLGSATLQSLQAAGVLQNPTINADVGLGNAFMFSPVNSIPIG